MNSPEEMYRDVDIVPPDIVKYKLTLSDVARRFAELGFPRSDRTLQRYCENGHLDAIKLETDHGKAWCIDLQSVEIRIEELRQTVATSRRHESKMSDIDGKWRDMAGAAIQHENTEPAGASDSDSDRHKNRDVGQGSQINGADERPTDPDNGMVSMPLELMQSLTNQLTEKDRQIKELLKDRESDRQMLTKVFGLLEAKGNEKLQSLPNPQNREEERVVNNSDVDFESTAFTPADKTCGQEPVDIPAKTVTHNPPPRDIADYRI